MGDRQIVRRALPAIRELAELPAGTKLLWASAPGGEYPVLVGRGLLDAGWWPLEGRRFLVTDRSVGPLYAERLEPLVGAESRSKRGRRRRRSPTPRRCCGRWPAKG